MTAIALIRAQGSIAIDFALSGERFKQWRNTDDANKRSWSWVELDPALDATYVVMATPSLIGMRWSVGPYKPEESDKFDTLQWTTHHNPGYFYWYITATSSEQAIAKAKQLFVESI